MIIAFVHNNKAFLPETEAYSNFFSQYGIRCTIVHKDEVGMVHRNVEWRLMGADLSKPREGIVKIHEYTSASVPPWRKLKDFSKSFFNAQPDFRLFLNEYVRRRFNFRDKIPYGFRDMGVLTSTAAIAPVEKRYDFVYAGDLSPAREPNRLLNCFSNGALKNNSLLVLSKDYDALREQYASCRNIEFIGPVPYEEVPAYLQQARYGINFVAEKAPFIYQTSTKFLEYAASGLPIVSTQYPWVQSFQQQYGGKYFYLSHGLENFTWENVTNASYSAPNLTAFTWENQIRSSGVLEFLQARFPKLSFT